MANEVDWVEDVRRWYLSGAGSGGPTETIGAPIDEVALGYEAADPALVARHWPEAPTKDR